MAGQLGHLISASALPSVSLGLIPARPDREIAWPVEGFWMFDDDQVAVELVSGHLTVTQPREIEMYAQAFAELSDIAVFGARVGTVTNVASARWVTLEGYKIYPNGTLGPIRTVVARVAGIHLPKET
jgi:hypothetical protein